MTSSLLAGRQIGNQRPRISHIPPFRKSYGADADVVLEEADRYLDDWQRHVLAGALGVRRKDGKDKWTAPEVGLSVPRQNGKGDIIMARELVGLFILQEPLIIHSAHLFQTSIEAFRRIVGVIEDSPTLRRMVAPRGIRTTTGQEEIRLRNGSRLRFLARSKGGGRGLVGDTIVLDEAFALADAHLEALIPVMSARPNPQIWYVSSPALDAVTGAVWMNVRRRGEAADPGLAWFDWGCEAGADLDDSANWLAANPAYGIRITHDSIDRERRSMTPEGFGRERLGIWPETAGESVIGPELWQSLLVRDVPPLVNPVFAIDVSPDRQSAALVAAAKLPDGRHLLSIIDSRPGTNWIAERAGQLNGKHKPLCWVLDARSPASTLLPDLAVAGVRQSDQGRPVRGGLVVMNTADAATAWGMFVDRARQKGLAHLDEAPLNVALANAKTRTLGDGSAWARRGASDISPLVAATEASWALATLADVVTAESEPSVHWL